MTFEKVNREEICTYKRTSNLVVLEEFLKTGFDCAELKDFGNSKAMVKASSLRQAAKRFRLGVDVISHGDRVFLVREK